MAAHVSHVLLCYDRADHADSSASALPHYLREGERSVLSLQKH